MDSQKTMPRRRFVEMLAAAGALSAFSLYGCSSSDNSASTTTADDSADKTEEGAEESGETTYADTITFAQGADPRGLDPAYVDDGESANVTINIYETLLNYAADSCELEPGLAKDWSVSDDGLTYEFTLYDGIKFHDGTVCDAEAVVKSISRQLEPDRTDDMPYASFVFGSEDSGTGIESIEATGDLTLTIKLRAVNAAFLKNIAMCLAAPIVSPTAVEEAGGGDINKAPVGTGPYKFVSWDEGENIKLVANDDYWNEDRKPKTKNIIFRFIPENASRVTALNNGEADIIIGIDDSVIPTIEDAGNKIFAADGMTINYMAFNTQGDVFNTVEARKAICEAINVPELVEALYGDYGTVAQSVMPLWMAPYDEDVEQPSYDPEQAKADIEAAGIPSKLKVITYSNTRPYNPKNGQTLAEAIQGYLQEVGIECDITIYDWTTYKSKVTSEDFDICFYGWQGDNGDPDNFMNLLADTNWSMNVARYENEDYNALIAQGQAETDEEARNEVYHQCELHVAENVPWLVISHAQNLAGYNPKVSGYYYHPTGIAYLYKVSKEA